MRVDKDYVFDAPEGEVTLAGLFDGRSQLLVYHFMFDPEWTQGCKSCSLLADHYNPSVTHLHHRDVTMVTVSRAPIEKIRAFRERMGWTFPWVSSFRSDFNRDFNVSFTEQELASESTVYNYESRPYPISELPGMSVFARDADGGVYHTYSTYARGLDMFLGVYHLLDITPKGATRATPRTCRGCATTTATATPTSSTPGWSTRNGSLRGATARAVISGGAA